MPMNQRDLAMATPIYEEVPPGWHEDISGARSFEDLPIAARDYVKRLEELCGARISGIGGVGPGREQAVMINDLL